MTNNWGLLLLPVLLIAVSSRLQCVQAANWTVDELATAHATALSSQQAICSLLKKDLYSRFYNASSNSLSSDPCICQFYANPDVTQRPYYRYPDNGTSGDFWITCDNSYCRKCDSEAGLCAYSEVVYQYNASQIFAQTDDYYTLPPMSTSTAKKAGEITLGNAFVNQSVTWYHLLPGWDDWRKLDPSSPLAAFLDQSVIPGTSLFESCLDPSSAKDDNIGIVSNAYLEKENEDNEACDRLLSHVYEEHYGNDALVLKNKPCTCENHPTLKLFVACELRYCEQCLVLATENEEQRLHCAYPQFYAQYERNIVGNASAPITAWRIYDQVVYSRGPYHGWRPGFEYHNYTDYYGYDPTWTCDMHFGTFIGVMEGLQDCRCEPVDCADGRQSSVYTCNNSTTGDTEFILGSCSAEDDINPSLGSRWMLYRDDVFPFETCFDTHTTLYSKHGNSSSDSVESTSKPPLLEGVVVKTPAQGNLPSKPDEGKQEPMADTEEAQEEGTLSSTTISSGRVFGDWKLLRVLVPWVAATLYFTG